MLGKCETCGNSYDKAFEIVQDGAHHVFDSFECAIQAMAPRCERCGTRVIGHGVEARGHLYCGAHCAHGAGAAEIKDRV